MRDAFRRTSPFVQSKDLLQSITSNQSLVGASADPYRSQQLSNVGLPSIRGLGPANQTIPGMHQIDEEAYEAAWADANQEYLDYMKMSGTMPGESEALPKIGKAPNDMNYKDLVLNMNQVPPGGRGGPGPGNLHEVTKEEAE